MVSIHAFRGEGDYNLDGGLKRNGVSIHAFRGEGDMMPRRVLDELVGFQSTPSGGKATREGIRCAYGRSVSIHAFRGEGDQLGQAYLIPS